MSKVLKLVNGRAKIYSPVDVVPESIVLIPHTGLPKCIHLHSFLRLKPGLVSIIINIY